MKQIRTSSKKVRGRAQASIDLIDAMYDAAEAAQPITGRRPGLAASWPRSRHQISTNECRATALLKRRSERFSFEDNATDERVERAQQDAMCNRGNDDESDNNNLSPTSKILIAALSGSDRCTAAGLVGRGATPVLAICRQLLAAGLNPDRALEVYRGATLALRVRSIGQGAGLEIASDGVGFRRARKPDAAPPRRQNRSGLPEHGGSP